MMNAQARSSVVVIRDSTPHDHWKPCLPPSHPETTGREAPEPADHTSNRALYENDAALVPIPRAEGALPHDDGND